MIATSCHVCKICPLSKIAKKCNITPPYCAITMLIVTPMTMTALIEKIYKTEMSSNIR